MVATAVSTSVGRARLDNRQPAETHVDGILHSYSVLCGQRAAAAHCNVELQERRRTHTELPRLRVSHRAYAHDETTSRNLRSRYNRHFVGIT